MTSYHYKLASSNNFEAFLKTIGIPENEIKAVADMEITIDITEDAEGYTVYTTNYGPEKFTVRYKLGEEYEYTHEGKKVKAIVTKGNGHTYTNIEQHGDYEMKEVREFIGDELKTTFTAKGITASQVYKIV